MRLNPEGAVALSIIVQKQPKFAFVLIDKVDVVNASLSAVKDVGLAVNVKSET
jgi:hypothetical protein